MRGDAAEELTESLARFASGAAYCVRDKARSLSDLTILHPVEFT